MAGNDGDRTRHFPAIEKKHGGPASRWVDLVRDMDGAKYAEQVAFLRENHGFSQAHANAVVMYARGSVSSKRHDSPEAFLDGINQEAAATVRAVFAAATRKNKGMELVIAWNQPCLRKGTAYVLGVSVSKQHLTLNPFSKDVIDAFRGRLADLGVSKHTFKVPFGWKPDTALLDALVKARLAEIG